MKTENKTYALLILIFLIVASASILITSIISYKNGQIDAIKGKYKYKQEIYLIWDNNKYCPVDTNYVKIEAK